MKNAVDLFDENESEVDEIKEELCFQGIDKQWHEWVSTWHDDLPEKKQALKCVEKTK